jgi:hypothetical protein
MSTNADRDFYDDDQFNDRRTFKTRRTPGCEDGGYMRRLGE